uniref:VP6 n=1 Tax=Lobuck virus TaxID=2800925 RepID=A0A894KPL5_9VIRU|nr:MAG: VP6 [Lobuck virus]
MTRIVLLAPSDVIEQCAAEIKERGISIKLREGKEIEEHRDCDSKEEKIKDGEPGRRTDKDAGKGRFRENDEPVDSDNGGGDRRKQLGSRRGGDHGGASKGSSRDCETEKDAQLLEVLGKSEDKNSNLEVRDGDKKVKEDESSELSKSKTQTLSVIDTYYVLHEDIADKLEQEYDLNVQTTTGKMSFSDKTVILELGPSLLKRLNLGSEVKDEQNDEMKRIKRITDSVKRKSTEPMKRTIRVDSEKGLSDLVGKKRVDPSKKKNLTHNTTRVAYVSNRIEDVEKAHAMFTAPTGDVGWKEVARLATKRSNIRAYRYTPGEISLCEAFTTLLDVV